MKKVDLKEKVKEYDRQLEEEVNQYIKEHGDEHIVPTPINPREAQLRKLKLDMLADLRDEEGQQELQEALLLIKEHLPRLVSLEEQEAAFEEFAHAADHFEEAMSAVEDPQSTGGKVMWEILGLSDETYQHCFDLMLSFYDNEQFQDAKKIASLLYMLHPARIDGGLYMGRCYDGLHEWQHAIDIYKILQENYPQDPTCRILCAYACINNGDKLAAKSHLDEGRKLLENTPELMDVWKEIVVQLQEALK